MFSHIHVGTNDFDRAVRFYSAVLSILGLELFINDPTHPWAAWRKPGSHRPLFIIGGPFDGQPATPGNGQMTAFLANDQATVERCYEMALTHGARDEGKPGLRPHYHAHYYGAYFRDLDGNKLCVACHSQTKGI
jgi:catechol 2,3-dioxygenase-like lactoylglutathione lyase family enzyme